MRVTHQLWQCPDCGQRRTRDEMLRARNPFDNDPEAPPVTGCPSCLACNPEWVEVCDEAGCTEPATCGTPSAVGYRRTCYAHRPETAWIRKLGRPEAA